MKRFLTIITLLIFTTGWAIGQQSNFQTETEEVLDSVITWKFSGSTDSTLSFRTQYKYDNQNRIILQSEDLREPATGVWAPYRKIEFGFDEWGNQNLWSIMFYENDYSAFVGLFKDENTYNASGQKQQNRYYGWDHDEFDWGNPLKTDFQYNQFDSLEWTYTYAWNKQAALWDTTGKVSYVYFPDGKLQTVTEWEPYEGTTVLYPKFRYQYEYNDSGKKILDSRSVYNPNTGIWYPYLKGEFEYNTDNKKTMETYFEYDEHTEYWLPMEKYVYDWNMVGSMIYYAEYKASEDTTWTKIRKEETEYSGSNQILSENYYSGNNEGNWVWTGKREYLYSSQDLLEETTTSQWNETTGTWKTLYQYKYTYDSLSRTSTVSYFTWINLLHRLELTTRDYYYYSENQTVGIIEQILKANLFYPNPATDILYLQSNELGFGPFTIEIFDTNGRKLLEKTVLAGKLDNGVDIRNLKTGLYLVRIRIQNQLITNKIIIRK